MADETWVDVELEERLSADARSADLPPPAWEALEGTLDEHAGWHDDLVSSSTRLRRMLALTGSLFACGILVGFQGVRGDLDPTGWLSFSAAGLGLVVVGVAGTGFALRPAGLPARPTWPLLLGTWAFVLVWSAIGPWPGMHGVPPAMHLVCFSWTSGMVLLATAWVALLDRASRPVPWRVGMMAASTGCLAFVAQSIFCPGVDLVHLLVGHGGPAIVFSALTTAGLLAWRRLR